MGKMIPDLCSKGSFFPKLYSALYGAEKYKILGIDYEDGSYISELPSMQTVDSENYNIPISSISLHNSSNVPVT